MSLDPSGQIAEQNSSYRKGLVLGLTMAEVGILIIFVLLLLIAIEQIRRDHLMQSLEGKKPIAEARLKELQLAENSLQEIAIAMGVTEETPPEDFRRLVRMTAVMATSPDGKSALVEARDAIREMKDASAQVRAAAKAASERGAEELVRQVESKSHQIANQEGQLKRYEKMLTDAGMGKGERPCWVKPDGTIEYLYEVVLGSDGIRMKEIDYPARHDERTLLPMPEIDPKEVLSEAEFLRRTRPLYNHSFAANCRFFVVIYDGTATHEKPLYKNLLRTVEGHFYKKLSLAAPPF
jgi:hypothetical protein